MADIRVTCPTCRAELEVDESFEGQEVECGSCLQVFVANRGRPAAPAPTPEAPPKRPASRPAGRGTPPRKPARRTDDYDTYEDDEEYSDDDYAPPPPRRTRGGDNGLGVASLVLGIISVVFFCCWPVAGLTSLIAIVCGIAGLRSRDGKGMAVAGLVLGIVGMALVVLTFAIGIGFGNLGRFR